MKKIFFAIVGFGLSIFLFFGSIGSFCLYFDQHDITYTAKTWLFSCVVTFFFSGAFFYSTYIIKKHEKVKSKAGKMLLNVFGFGSAVFAGYLSLESLYCSIVGCTKGSPEGLIVIGVIDGLMSVVLFCLTCLILRINSTKKVDFKKLFFGCIGFGLAVIMFFSSAYCLFCLIQNYNQSLSCIGFLIGMIIGLLTSVTLTYWTYLIMKNSLVFSKIKKGFFGFIGFGIALYWFVEGVSRFYFFKMSYSMIVGAIIILLIGIILTYWTYLIIKKK